jgi:hypothetical protein
MLYKFLKLIQAGEVQSLLEIASAMHISPDMVLRMAEELARKGYLQEISADCTDSRKNCPDCPTNNTCQVIVKHWILTEKGRSAISGR